MAYNAIICKYGMMILVWEVLRLSMNRTCWLLGVSIENTVHTPSKLQYELDFIKTVMTVEDYWCMINWNHESCRHFQEFFNHLGKQSVFLGRNCATFFLNGF